MGGAPADQESHHQSQGRAGFELISVCPLTIILTDPLRVDVVRNPVLPWCCPQLASCWPSSWPLAGPPSELWSGCSLFIPSRFAASAAVCLTAFASASCLAASAAAISLFSSSCFVASTVATCLVASVLAFASWPPIVSLRNYTLLSPHWVILPAFNPIGQQWLVLGHMLYNVGGQVRRA